MNRISREQAFMLTAQVWSQRSTCMRRNVGAVVVVGKHIVSHGYNGAPAGEPHCDGMTCIPPGEVGCSRAIHAEANAILHIPKGLERASKLLFTTESPCVACAARISDHGYFQAVYYLNEYRVEAGIKHLIKQGTQVFRMTPAGMVIRKAIIDGYLVETLVGE